MKGSSKTSRYSQKEDTEKITIKEQRIFGFFEKVLKENEVDYFLFGHLHTGARKKSKSGLSEFINLGDWTSLFTYGVMDESGHFKLKSYNKK